MFICETCNGKYSSRGSLRQHQAQHQNKKFKCTDCDKLFIRKSNLRRHEVLHKPLQDVATIKCSYCQKCFSRKDNLKQHEMVHKRDELEPLQCEKCKRTFKQKAVLLNHVIKNRCKKQKDILQSIESENRTLYKRKASPDRDEQNVKRICIDAGDKVDNNPCKFSEAIDKNLTTYKIDSEEENMKDLNMFLKDCLEKLIKIINNELSAKQNIKWYLNVCVQFSKNVQQDQLDTITPYFLSNCCITLQNDPFTENIQEGYLKILKSFEEFQKNGSGWFLESVLFLEIKIAKYRPLDATSYIELPKKLRLSHAIINVENYDQNCFLWSVLAALHPQKKHPQRVSKYRQFKDELNIKGLDFPFPLSQIPKFEKMNTISINVYGYEKQIFPLHITKQKYDKHVNLLLISNGENSHYCFIKNLNKLLNSLTKHKCEAFYCVYCLHRFYKKKTLDDHILICQEHGAQKITLPNEDDKWMKFTNFHFQLKVPYVIYADFETFNVKIDTCQPSLKTSFTMQKTRHEPSGFCYIVVDSDGKSQEPVVYRGPDVVHKFLTGLLDEEEKIILARKTNIPMSFTVEDEEKYNASTHCHICEKPLLDDKVRDHDHMNGLFRGAAHNTCNRSYRYTNKIPVVIHNLKGFDSHLIMQGIGKFKNKKITVIPNNMEKYISFSMDNLNFIDSFQFMNTSLEKLVSNLPEKDFFISKTHIPEEKVSLLLRKGVYPYTYMDGVDKFVETCLPPKEAFTNDLTGEAVSDADYLHAQNVWSAFNLRHLGEYHDLYMLSDVLLLADVFENYRKMCLNFYKIDPCHTYTAPGLAWHACLKMTGVELELLTDVDMYLFIERGIRGGISMIANRYGEANNKYMENYDPAAPSKYLSYLDANNLYGWAMIRKMPIRDFKWMTESEIECLDVTAIDEESDTGYVLEVDLEYPQHLHDAHNDYPLAPEKMKIKAEMLSPYMKNLVKTNNDFINMVESTKLVPNLYDKKNYIVHSTNLKMYLKYGLKLLHIHKGISFRQEAWLQPYIEFNTVQRAKATNAFEKDNFKLLNNAVFGKTMENLRNRINVRLITNVKKLCTSSPPHQLKPQRRNEWQNY